MRTLLLLSILLVPLAAQGAGTLSSVGEEIALGLSGRVTASTSTITLDHVPNGATLFLLAGATPANLPTAGLGIPGGALGVDFASGALLGLPFMSIGGSAAYSFVVPASLSGTTTWMQGIILDPGLPSPGIALTDALPATFGSAASTLLGLDIGGVLSMRRVAADLSAVGPLGAALDGITLLDVRPAATFDTASRSIGLPWHDLTDPTRPRVLLPDGAHLYRYLRGTREGLFVTSPAADEVLATVEFTAMIDPIVAVSPFQPIVAFVTVNAVPGLNGAALFFLRIDGSNWPGRTTPWAGITFSGSLAGFAPESTSLTFLDGVMIATDKVKVARIPIDGITPAEWIPLPPSGGLIPVEVDEQLAWSAQGTTAAFTAGQSNQDRDVYALGVVGPAVNVTQFVAEYDDIAYDDIVAGGLIALSPDGTRLACVRKLGNDEDVIVEETGISAASLNVTPPALFGNSIESESGILYLSRDELLFTNGLDVNQKDVYRTVLPSTATGPITVSNLTGTSGLTTAPFSAGGTLELAGRGRLAGGGVLFDLNAGPSTPHMLVIAAPGVTPIMESGVDGSPTSAASANATYVGYAVAGAARIRRIDATGAMGILHGFGAGTRIVEMAYSAASDALLAVVSMSGQEIPFIVDALGNATMVSGTLPTTFVRGISVMSDGSFLVRTSSGISVSLLRVDPLNAVATTIGTTNGLTVF